ncbi:hypothetical protein [Streptomyces beigongshangae]|nr:hypothetical protein [Streptomyces sp. REN17]
MFGEEPVAARYARNNSIASTGRPSLPTTVYETGTSSDSRNL